MVIIKTTQKPLLLEIEKVEVQVGASTRPQWVKKSGHDLNRNARKHNKVFVLHRKKFCILAIQNALCEDSDRSAHISDCANAQADLNVRWAHISELTFSDVAQIDI